MHTPEAQLVMGASTLSDRPGSMRSRLARVLGLTGEYLDASLGHVFLVREDERGRAVPTSIWWGESARTAAFQSLVESHMAVAGEGLAGQVLDRERLVISRDLSREAASEHNRRALAAGLRGAVGVPLLAADAIVGGLELYLTAPFDRSMDAIAPALEAVGHIAGRIVERDRFERRADGARAKLAVAASLSRIGTFELERDTYELTPSQELCAVLDVDVQALADVPALIDTVTSHQRRQLAEAIFQLCDHGGSFTIEDAVTDDAGSVHWFVVSARAVAGRVIGVVQDVTALHEARIQRDEAQHRANELAALTSELARSNAELDRFAYIASHDLKAPLRGIANVASWLREDLADHLDGDSLEHLRLLMGRVQRMERMLEGMLQYAGAGRRTHSERGDAGDIIREQIALVDAPEQVEVRVSDAIPPLEVSEPVFAQVVRHLIANAVVHGCPKGGHIDIYAEDQGDVVRFYVADDGVGIAPRHQDKIFQPFQTLQPRDTVETTGIGLALVKKIVEQRGGSVGVDSRPEAGAAFYFDWPREQRRAGRGVSSDQSATG